MSESSPTDEKDADVIYIYGETPESLESYCVSCGESGTTTFLRRNIPFFHDVIIASFSCPHCGFRSTSLNTVDFAERGSRYELKVTQPKDFDREIIRTEYAAISIPELELEIPANLERKGEINTIEGVITSIIDSLNQLQPVRKVCSPFFLNSLLSVKIQQPELATKIDEFIGRLQKLLERTTPFTFIIDDPTGNSFVENPLAPQQDPQMKFTSYIRSREQCEFLGLNVGTELGLPNLKFFPILTFKQPPPHQKMLSRSFNKVVNQQPRHRRSLLQQTNSKTKPQLHHHHHHHRHTDTSQQASMGRSDPDQLLIWVRPR